GSCIQCLLNTGAMALTHVAQSFQILLIPLTAGVGSLHSCRRRSATYAPNLSSSAKLQLTQTSIFHSSQPSFPTAGKSPWVSGGDTSIGPPRHAFRSGRQWNDGRQRRLSTTEVPTSRLQAATAFSHASHGSGTTAPPWQSVPDGSVARAGLFCP